MNSDNREPIFNPSFETVEISSLQWNRTIMVYEDSSSDAEPSVSIMQELRASLENQVRELIQRELQQFRTNNPDFEPSVAFPGGMKVVAKIDILPAADATGE